MSTILKARPWVFYVGVLLLTISAPGLWPNAVPWGVAFWIGWIANDIFLWAKSIADQQQTIQEPK